MKYLLSLFIYGLLLTLAVPVWAEEPLKMGVLAFRPKAQALDMWSPLGDYLTAQLGRDVEITTYNYSEFGAAIAHNQIDIVLTNPAHYILLRYQNNLSAPLVTQITKKGTHELTAFGGVIFTRADSSIQSLSNIVGKRIAVTKEESLGGYQMQAYELLLADLPQPSKSKLVLTGMPHDKVVASVLSGHADVGFVRTGVIESLVSEGKLDLASIKIINDQHLSSYPFLLSTHLYPEWPVAVMQDIDEKTSRQLTVALLGLKQNNSVAIQAHISGFTIPANYNGVETLLRRLRSEPFNFTPEITLYDLWYRYSQWIIAISILIILLLSFGMRLVIQRKQLRVSKEIIVISEQQLKNVIRGADLGFWDWNYKTGEYIVNERWLFMLGLTAQQGRNDVHDWDNLIYPSDKAAVLETIRKNIIAGTAYTIEFRMKHTDGHWVWIQGAGSVVEYDDVSHEPIRLCGTHQDISKRKASEERIKLISRVFSDTQEGVNITDANGIIIDVNPAFCKITGFSREEVIGQSPSILGSGRQPPNFYKKMWESVDESGFWQGEVWNRKKNGEIYAELLSISTLLDDSGKITNYVGVFSDITQSKQQQEKLNLMAHYDVLTGLPNRALFIDHFHQAIAHSKRTEHQLAICFLDLDNFKPVNDNFGHEIGDQLLIEVANRISQSIREEDTVSRQGGDEFALLLNDIESLSQCESTLARILHTLAQPYVINDCAHNITASIGVTLYPDDNEDIDTLVRHADNAMYQAKQSGKHRYHVFDRKQDKLLAQKHHKLDTIQHALINNEFQLYYQPKVNMVTGKVFGAEALIRWFHPKEGLIPPLDFLPIIDGTDIEIQVGDWVIDNALQQMEYWLAQGIKLEVSVNIASHHLMSDSFFTNLESALARYSAVDSRFLQLEILESSALIDLLAISHIIAKCQEVLGIHVALDDFGTGYSSLAHLRSLTANTIKIDQSFVRDMLDDPDDYTIINGVIGLANSFNRTVIAEGVETTEHGLMLLIMGCEEAQGYGVAKPMPADTLPKWLSEYTPNSAWLAYAKGVWTNKENKIKLYQLTSERWKNSFIAKVQSLPKDNQSWPIMSAKSCNCARWINQAEKDGLFDKDSLARLEKTHKEVHLLAQAIQVSYQEGDIDIAEESIESLVTAYNEMNHSLALCG